MQLIITFDIENKEEGEKIKRMVRDGFHELTDGGFYDEQCDEQEIKSFCSTDFHIRLTSD